MSSSSSSHHTKDVFEQSISSDSEEEEEEEEEEKLDSPSAIINPQRPRLKKNNHHHSHSHNDNLDPTTATTTYDQLPIELLSMVDRFVNSLSAKSYTSPPSIDRISDLFQNFYIRANDIISTHVATLAASSRQSRNPSPSQDVTTTPGGGGGGDDVTDTNHHHDTNNNNNDHQMLTPSQVAQRRKSRKYLHKKRLAMEEAVERRVCEAVYKKIWRHRTTMDEVRDEKLRSKTAALTVVGIGLKDLGVDIGGGGSGSGSSSSSGDSGGDDGHSTTDIETTSKRIDESLEPARQSLLAMNDAKYPLGKLQHLNAAHKSIVDTLTNVFPSNSSADEILPTLIYTLITGPPEGICIISNFLFIQRFRTASKIDGEAAYCLTNLEASISFLENVDLSSLRADEAQTSAPSFASGGGGAGVVDDGRLARSSTMPAATVAGGSMSKNDSSGSGGSSNNNNNNKLSLPRTRSSRNGQSPTRRLSDLFQPPAKVLGAANDAVRSTADQGLRNFTATLDNSFKFFLGRLSESQAKSPEGGGGGVGANAGAGAVAVGRSPVVVVPKTLDEARLLVGSPGGVGAEEEKEEKGKKERDKERGKEEEEEEVGDGSGDVATTAAGDKNAIADQSSRPATATATATAAAKPPTPTPTQSTPPPPPPPSNPTVEDRFIGLIGGRKPPRVGSWESMRSQRRVVSDNATVSSTSTTATAAAAAVAAAAAAASNAGSESTAADGKGGSSNSKNDNNSKDNNTSTTTTTTTSSSFFQSNSSSTNAFTSMKSFNPLSHIPDMIRGFGKNLEAEKEKEKEKEREKEKEAEKEKEKEKQHIEDEEKKKLHQQQQQSRNVSPPPNPPSLRDVLGDVKPPIQRFVDLRDSAELKLADVPELLEDYKRLADIVTKLSAS